MFVEASDKRKPIGVLMIEHRLIERALNVLETKISVTGVEPDVIAFAELIDFFWSYADASHHGKEEDLMFVEADQLELSPDLEKALAELRENHVQFRGFRRAMAEAIHKIAAGQMEAVTELISTAREFIPRLRQHIVKEDKVFFPGFDKLQSARDRDAMKTRFMEFDMERIHETYKSVVDRNE